MTGRTDVEHLLELYLAEGPETVADRVVDDALEEIDHTPQSRRLLAPGRNPAMVRPFRFLLGAAAVIALVIAIAFALRPLQDEGVAAKPTATLSSNPTASPSLSPTATPTAQATPTPEPTPKGVVSTTFQRPFTITVPEDWRVVIDEPDMYAILRPLAGDPQAPEVGIDLTVVENVYADPCDTAAGQREPPLGPAPMDLAAWMASLESLQATDPVETEIAGYPALTLDEALTDPGCAVVQAFIVMWDTDAGWVFTVERKRYFMFEVDGLRIVAVIVGRDGTFDRDVDEAMSALQSIEFR